MAVHSDTTRLRYPHRAEPPRSVRFQPPAVANRPGRPAREAGPSMSQSLIAGVAALAILTAGSAAFAWLATTVFSALFHLKPW